MSRIVYFECREDNHDKFYLMTEDPTGTTFVARWGRIGTEGSFCAYSISNWNKKLHERLSHGYVDRTQDYLDGKINGPAAWTEVGGAKYKMSGTRKTWLGHELYKIVATKTFETVEAMKSRPEKLADGLKSLKISTKTGNAGLLTKPLSLAALPA